MNKRQKLLSEAVGRAQKEIRSTAMESSFGRRKDGNLRRFANGIPKGIPIKSLTENNLLKSLP